MSDKMTTLKDEITGDNVYPNIKNDNIESKSITSDKLVDEYATTESVNNDIATSYTNSIHNTYSITSHRDLYATINYQDIELRAHQDKDGGEGFINIIGETSVELSTNDTQITISDGDIYTNSGYEPIQNSSIVNKKYVDDNKGTNVVANSTESTSDTLTSLKVGDVNYAIASGGGSTSELYLHFITAYATYNNVNMTFFVSWYSTNAEAEYGVYGVNFTSKDCPINFLAYSLPPNYIALGVQPSTSTSEVNFRYVIKSITSAYNERVRNYFTSTGTERIVKIM